MITSDMTIASVMRLDPEVAPVFMSFGMHCLYCPHASAESIAEASLVLVCRTLYQAPLKEEYFRDTAVMDKNYPEKDFHDLYIGHIEKVLVSE